MTRVTVVRKSFNLARQRIAEETEKRLDRFAEDLRDELQKALDLGALPIQSDTAALSQSLFVQNSQGSDYDVRLMAAAVAYLSENSKWLAPVRAKVTPFAYEKEHFAERVAPEEPLSQSAQTARAAVATMLAYGAFWEFGHSNEFTGREERRPWFEQRSMDFAFANMAGYFYNLLS